MKIISKNILGVLWLDEEIEIQKKGEIGSKKTYGCPVIIEPAPNTSVARVLLVDDSLIRNIIESGKKLIERGATAITSACGFTIWYQKQISSALNIPVAASSLLLFPYLA